MPNDPAFQKRVLMAALGLLDRPAGPVLEDFPEDAPVTAAPGDDEMTGLVCPVSFPQPPDETAPTSEIGQAVMAEIASLAPWYDLALRTRGRTTVGVSGLTIDQAAKYVLAFLDDQDTPAPRDDMPVARVLKLAYEDLKSYYAEAITAQPGYASSLSVETWLFQETSFGRALWMLRDICRASDDEYFQYLGRNSIVPDRQINPA